MVIKQNDIDPNSDFQAQANADSEPEVIMPKSNSKPKEAPVATQEDEQDSPEDLENTQAWAQKKIVDPELARI